MLLARSAFWIGVLALTTQLGACIDGGRLSGPTPDGFVIPGVVPPDAVANLDATLVGDVTSPDLPDVVDIPPPDVADVPDGVDIPPPDVADVPVVPDGVDGGPDAGCSASADCGADDGNLCNGGWDCVAGACVAVDPIVCSGDGLGPCEVAACSPVDGACVTVPAGDGSACNDGDACTIGDRCSDGACAGQQLYCDDANPCTADSCSAGGCVYSNLQDTPCDDANPCTLGEVCNGLGQCAGGANSCACGDTTECPTNTADLCAGTIVCAGGFCRNDLSSVTQGTCADASDPCKVGRCDPSSGGCVVDNVPDGSGCDDGDACTTGDTCVSGVCAGTAIDCGGSTCAPMACDPTEGCLADGAADVSSCGCETTADCAASEDGDACNGTLVCAGGTCVVDPATVKTCGADGPNPCVSCSCDPTTGEVTIVNASEGLGCDDGDPCSDGTTCSAGACVGGTSLDCGAPDACSDTFCHPFVGCVSRPIGRVCGEDDKCTSDACAAGQCVVGPPKVCPAAAACHVATCQPASGNCVETPAPAGAECSDDDACTQGDLCDAAGACVSTPIFCDDGNPCTNDLCAGGNCTTVPNTALCNDGNACTAGDVCGGGHCLSGQTTCACEDATDCAGFDDGDPCTGVVTCIANTCVTDHSAVPVCDASGNTPCSVNTCVAGACAVVARAEGMPCDDGSQCSSDEVCTGGSCEGTDDCDDGNACTLDACVDGLCIRTPDDGVACDDGTECTQGTTCNGGVCGGGTNTCACVEDTDCAVNDVSDCAGSHRCADSVCVIDPTTILSCPQGDNPCLLAVCDAVANECGETLAPNGTACSDDDACTTGDACFNGTCAGAATVTCEAGPCRTAACDTETGQCVVTPAGGGCNDGDACTQNDTCVNGACVGQGHCDCVTADDCEAAGLDLCAGVYACLAGRCQLVPDTAVTCDVGDATACSFSACDPADGQCKPFTVPASVECDDEDPCTVLTRCDASAQCVGDELDCDDGSPCTTDTCDPVAGCVHTPLDDGGSCDDGDACTGDGTCIAGACVAQLNDACPCSPAAPCPSVGICDGAYQCTAGKCVKQPAVVCADSGNPCRPNVCNPTSGECGTINVADVPCTDGNLCTRNDFCLGGQCTGDVVSCNDGNECTDDTCDAGFCFNVPNEAPCDDGDPICTLLDRCSEGVCQGFNACSCQTDSQCLGKDPDGRCNGRWGCVDNLCQPIPDTEVFCSDPDPYDCVDIACNDATGQCDVSIGAPNDPCDDGTACTANDVCDASGNCVGEVEVACADANPDDCVVPVCHPILKACIEERVADGEACDDGTPCTDADVCVAGSCQGVFVDCGASTTCSEAYCSLADGCQTQEFAGACEGADPCITGMSCEDGVCGGGSDVCAFCTEDGDCAGVDDGNACTGTYHCADNQRCEVDPATVVSCELSADPCMVVACDPLDGMCKTSERPAGEECDDDDSVCTVSECVTGTCETSDISCDDGNVCTEDTCDTVTGCANEPVVDPTTCDDGVVCNGDGTCDAGVCVAGTGASCPCLVDADCAAFDDADLCNAPLVCDLDTSECVPDLAQVVVCPATPEVCKTNVCVPATGECVVEDASDGTLCNDGDACTVGDACQAATCSGVPADCRDDDPCTTDACLAGFGCVHNDFVGPCDDGNPCTANEYCLNGTCALFGQPPVDCNDGNPCTDDSCAPQQGGCVNTPKPDGIFCETFDACNTAQCDAGECVVGALECDCTIDSDCPVKSGGSLCAAQYTCSLEGKCILGEPVVCDADTDCLDWECDPGTGVCSSTVLNEGLGCSDGNDCTESDVCTAGVCSGAPVVCTTEVPCRESVCVPQQGCALQDANATPCDDGNSCSVDDRCVAGQCKPGPLAERFTEDFESGALADGWTVSSTGTNATWSVLQGQSLSEPFAMFAGNPASLTNEDDPGGEAIAWSASVLTHQITIPSHAQDPKLVFGLWRDLRSGCASDVFEVRVNGASIHKVCGGSASSGWVAQEVDLTVYKGATVRFEFLFDTKNAVNEARQGVWVDEIVFDWECSQ